MTIWRMTATLIHDDGLARDNASMTVHAHDTEGDADPLVLANDFANFFTATQSTGRNLLLWLATTHDYVQVKTYEVNDFIDTDGVVRSGSGEPKAATGLISLGGTKMSTSNMPSEVALCVSMRDTDNVTVPLARRTGRIYFGPLNQGAMDAAGGLVCRPAANLIADLNAAVAKLKADIGGHSAALAIYSRPFAGRPLTERPGRAPLRALAARPTGAYYTPEQVWVDDAFDTQRRRGERPTAKTIATI